MLKQLTRRPWICSACRKHTRRRLSGISLAPSLSQTEPSLTDDDALRKLFDSQGFWKDFSRRRPFQDGKKRGLLQNKHLTSPQGYMDFAQESLERCRKLVNRLIRAKTNEDYKTFARDFDRLSDQLCRVIDSVEFVRNVHPDSRIQQAATRAHGAMFEYMNVLNTHKVLYDQLKKSASIPEVVASWSAEDKATTSILLRDFEQSAIGESEEVRNKFVQLSTEIVQAGSEMLEYMTPAKESLRFSSTQLKGMDPVTVKSHTRFGTTTIPIASRAASLAMKTVENADVRKELYMASRTSSKSSIARVEHLVTARAELAQLCGHNSFAHMTLSDKMAKTPAAVNQFLSPLAVSNKSAMAPDLAELLSLKSADTLDSTSPSTLHAWDRAYYTRRLRSLLYPAAQSRPPDLLSAYFSLGTVMQGLSRLFTRLFGVHLRPCETSDGETWNDDIRRLDVIDENEGHIAVLYCDLFARPHKTPNPAHFTLRCSREISTAEINEAVTSGLLPSNPSLYDLSDVLNDGMALSYSPTTRTLHQLPTIAFICDFPRPSPTSSTPTLLTFNQVSTLYHEMGHALHSILGRTSLQNVAGTRCATDFAELPSILMEYFAASPEVLSLYARHWSTDEPLNPTFITDELAANRRLLASQETEAQLLFSVLDQRYHAPGIGPGVDSSAVYHEVYNDPALTSVAEPRGTSWQGFFGHLYGYGGVYYSYLFDRAIAGRVWRDVFAPSPSSASSGAGAGAGYPFTSGAFTSNNTTLNTQSTANNLGLKGPLDRAAGQRYRDEVLKWGGSRDPWRCVAGVLGKEYEWMGEGGERAMQEVGRWGVGEGGEAGAPL